MLVPDTSHGRNSYDDSSKNSQNLTASELIGELTSRPNTAAMRLYTLISTSKSESIEVSSPHEMDELRKVIESYFAGPNPVLSAAEGSGCLTCGAQQIMNFARFLNSPELALHVACRSHYGVEDALTMLFDAMPNTPASIGQLAKTLFPKFGQLSDQELSQRLKVIEALGKVAFSPRPRPAEFGDRSPGPQVPVVAITPSARTSLSEELLAFLDGAKLFQSRPTQNSEAYNAALHGLSRAIAVGGLISEPHQIRRALSIFPELTNVTCSYIANFSRCLMNEQLRQAAAIAALNWGDELIRAIELETKMGSLETGRCLVNLGLGQLNGNCEANLILRICDPRSEEFSRFRAEIAAELKAQFKDKYSPLKEALSPTILPTYIDQSPGNKPYAERTAYNVSKLRLYDYLLKHEDREIRVLAAAEMRKIGHQFHPFLLGESKVLYLWTQIRANRLYRFASSILP